VVEDFLRMARQQPIELRDCSIREELETIITLVAKDAQDRGVTLRLESNTEEIIVRGDGEKLRQAFLNIVLNALQATPKGGDVTISCRQSDAGWQIAFRDTGPGIDAETKTRIFEPFFTTKPDGTGLGLAVTRKIIEAHHGTLEVESEVGRGTTVVVMLPAAMSV
jgi:two-component system sensor histidine kinase HydH